MSSVQQWLERVGLSEVEGLVAAFLAVADDISDVRMMNEDDVATAVISLNLKKMTMARVQKEVAALRDEASELPAAKTPAQPVAAGEDALYCGIDLSTQSATGCLVDSRLRVVLRRSINFDEALGAEFGTTAGMHVRPYGDGGDGDNATRVTSPVAMWVKALDLLMSELAASGKMGHVASISCSGQQHGTVYLTRQGVEALHEDQPDDHPYPVMHDTEAITPEKRKKQKKDQGGSSSKQARSSSSSCSSTTTSPFAALLLKPAIAFALEDSPIWADSSTESQCVTLEALNGGAAALATLTGSRAYCRFSAAQIAAVAERQPAEWQKTQAVCLVSSFAASLLLGRVAPIDTSDGSGMNLMNLMSLKWESSILHSGALPKQLNVEMLGGEPVPSHAVLGCASRRVCDAWGLPSTCKIVASSGDNPCTLAGLGLSQPGDLALSLGTSDTLLGVTARADATPQLEGHMMAHPTDPDAAFAMLCYKNAGAARQAIRDERCGGSWASFDAMLRASPPGNGGVLALCLTMPEITPEIGHDGLGHHYINANGTPLAPSDVDDAVAVRGVIEGRFLSMRARGESLGLRQQRHCLLATGGGARSSEILQIAADVFDSIVLVGVPTSDAAAIGAARRAAHALEVDLAHKGDVTRLPFSSFVCDRSVDPALVVAARPRPWAVEAYKGMAERYKAFEDRVRRKAAAERSEAAAGQASVST